MPSKAALEKQAEKEREGPQALPDEVTGPLIEEAVKKVEKESASTTLFDSEKEALFARFDNEEIKMGGVLGHGGFCDVFEVSGFELAADEEASSAKIDTEKVIPDIHTREYMAMTCIRQGDARYAIKRLSSNSMTDKNLFGHGLADLAIEAKFLAVVQHSNIIKMRGLSTGDVSSGNMFIVMDRLYDTLETKIRTWREQLASYQGFMCCGTQKDKQDELFADRIEFGWDLASALEHIHNLGVIYRDIKPENIGFDIRGNIKIFDFGLAKELGTPDDDGNYKLTGYCGSPAFMAPEVIKCVPYNLSADVYSFAILFWQMMSLETPYMKVNLNVMERIVVNKNHRPPMDTTWPTKLIGLLNKAWHPLSAKRPGFDEVTTKLNEISMELGGESEMHIQMDVSTRSFTDMLEKVNKAKKNAA